MTDLALKTVLVCSGPYKGFVGIFAKQTAEGWIKLWPTEKTLRKIGKGQFPELDKNKCWFKPGTELEEVKYGH